MTQPPDDEDLPPLRRRPVVASAPVSGALAAPEQPGPVRAYPGHTYGRSLAADVYPQQPAPDAQWPLVTGTPPRPRRRVLGITFGITLLLLVAAGTVGAWLLVGPAGIRGSGTPGRAVDGFLTGIYETRDARAAGRYVCERARDETQLEQIVFQVRQHDEAYTAARTTWSYPEIQPNGRQASAEVTLTMTTANEQVATRIVTLLLVDDRGWWVCDVR